MDTAYIKPPKGNLKSQQQIRAAFWREHPQFAADYVPGQPQNFYRVEIREAFVNFLDQLNRAGIISTRLAFDATL